MAKFLLLAVSGREPLANLSPNEMQAILQRYVDWTDKMRVSGRLLGSHKLKNGEGRLVTREEGKVIVRDGPFSEAKEVIGGYWLVEAPSYEAALEYARSSPQLEFGSLLIREVDH
jgi:hypothetical protein